MSVMVFMNRYLHNHILILSSFFFKSYLVIFGILSLAFVSHGFQLAVNAFALTSLVISNLVYRMAFHAIYQ